MSIKVVTELTCDNCGKTERFTGDVHQSLFNYLPDSGLPKCWFRFEPNIEQSIWTTADYSVSGDLCSLECTIAFLQKKIEERDNPKPLTVGGFSFERYGD